MLRARFHRKYGRLTERFINDDSVDFLSCKNKRDMLY